MPNWRIGVEQAKSLRAQREAFQKQQHSQALAEDVRAMNIMAFQGDVDGVAGILESRVNTLRQQGGDPTESLTALNMIRSGDPQKIGNAFADLAQAEQIAVANGVLEPITGQRGKEGLASAKTMIYDNGTVLQALPGGGSVVYGPRGTELRGDDRAAALQTARSEQITHAGALAGSKASGSGAAARGQEIINFGYDAAKAMPTLKRAIQLLDLVDTGGYDAAAVRAKQLFGVESANEAELSNSLGKAVLSQLRATFGAQFTEREGAKLDRIEANFGKSTAGNKRLLQQVLTMSEKYVDAAISRAASSGDYATVEELMDLRQMVLEAPGGDDPDPLGIRQ